MICGDFATTLLEVGQHCGLDAAMQIMMLSADVPDCEGSAYNGWENCTCIEMVYDVDQAEPIIDSPLEDRPKMCGDCAYRPRSSEALSDSQAAYGPEDLLTLAYGTTPFHCHQGVRRIVAYVHTPTGTRFEVLRPDMSYDPPTKVLVENGKRTEVRFRTDGRRLETCAGWRAKRESLLRQEI